MPACALLTGSAVSVQAEIAPFSATKANSPPTAYRTPIESIGAMIVSG
jgi:hypothetical protein